MGTPAQTKATVKYIKNNTKTYVVRCNVKTDSDIIEFLASKDNVAGYIKGLLREETRKNL